MLLFTLKPELVIMVPNLWKNRKKPSICFLNLDQQNIYDLTPDEADWLVLDGLVELDGGESDMDKTVEYRQSVYQTTKDGTARFKQIITDLLQGKFKIGSSKKQS